MEQQQYKRQTAYLCNTQELAQGKYVKQEGWEPSFLRINDKMYARIRIVGIVVEHSAQETVLDDGKGRVTIRSFDNNLANISVGMPLMVIGRPRTFNDQLYVLAEIAKIITPNWIKYFSEQKDSFKAFIPAAPEEVEVEEQVIETSTTPQPVINETANEEAITTQKPKNDKGSLIDIIRELDPGDGAAVDEIIAKSGMPDAEEKLQFLITQGEVFELRAGKVKVLE